MHPTAALPPHRLRLARLPDPRPGFTAGARFVGNSWWCTGLFLRFVSVPSPWVTAPTIAPASTLNGLSFPPERAYVMIENLARVRDRPLGSFGQNFRKFESRSRPPVRRTAQCDGGRLAEEGPYLKRVPT